jgi:hypothetical protein
MRLKVFLKLGLFLFFFVVCFVAKSNQVLAAPGGSLTSTQSGPFNIGTTWGGACTSVCVAGTDFPGLIKGAIIASGTTVTLDSPRTIPSLTINAGGVFDDNSNLITLTAGGFTYTVNGTHIGSGGVALTGSTYILGVGTITSTGTTTISTTGSNFDATANLTFSGPIVISDGITVTNKGTVTMNPGSYISGTVASSTWVQFTDSTLNFGGSSLMATGTLIATSTGNTVNYNLDGDQTCNNTSYYNLTFSGSGTKVCNPTSVVNVTTSGTVTWSPSAWYSTGGTWGYRKAITIDHNKLASSTNETYANFPVLISVTDSDLVSHASSTGADILFTTNDGLTKLNHEIETYASSTGNLVAWVNVGSAGLSTSTDTTLYMYYGNSSATDQQTATSTWDSNFAAVYHMKETLTGNGQLVYDSTVNAVNATSTGLVSWAGSQQVPGQVGGSLNFNTTYLISSSTVLRVVRTTTEAWVKTTSTDKAILVDLSLPKFGDLPYAMDITSTGLARFYVKSAGVIYSATSTMAVNDNNWHSIVGTYDGTTMRLYIDGVLNITDTSYSGDLPLVGILDIGSDGNSRIMLGQVDEMRISSLARSADWVATEFANQNSPSSFVSAGVEQTEISGAQNISGSLTIGANTTAKSTTDVLTIGGDFTNNGIFTHNNGTVVFNTAGTSIISGTSTAFNNLTLVTPGQTIKFHTAVSNPPVYSFAGVLAATGTSGSLISIQSDLPGTQWVPYFSSSQTGIFYANITDSGCFAGTQNITLSNSQNGGNNASCWQGFVVVGGGGGGNYYGGSATPVESGGGAGATITGGDSGGGGGTPPVDPVGGPAVPPVVGGGGDGGAVASP